MKQILKFVAVAGLFLSATGCVNNEQKKNEENQAPAKVEAVE